MLEDEAHQKQKLEQEVTILKTQLLQLSFESDKVYCLKSCEIIILFVSSFILISYEKNYPMISHDYQL